MEYDNPFNTLTFDEKLLNEKMGYAFSDPDLRPKAHVNMNERVRRKMMEEDILREEIRREIQIERMKRPAGRENFVAGLEQVRTDTQFHPKPSRIEVRNDNYGSDSIEGCTGGGDGGGMSDDEPLVNNKILLILVFVLAAFCVVQYINQQALAASVNDMVSAMCQMSQGQPVPVPQPAVSAVSPTVAVPVTTPAPVVTPTPVPVATTDAT